MLLFPFFFFYQKVFCPHQDIYSTFFPSHPVRKLQSCFFPSSLLKSTTRFVMIVLDSCLLFSYHLLKHFHPFSTELFPKLPKYSTWYTFIHTSEHPPFYYHLSFQNNQLGYVIQLPPPAQKHLLVPYCCQNVQTS